MLQYLIDGGSMMLPLFVCSVIGLAVIIDRARVFKVTELVDPEALFQGMSQRLEKGDVDGAIRFCQESKGPIAAVLYVGLQKYKVLLEMKWNRAEIEANLNKTISEYAPHVLQLLEKRLNILLLVGSIAPLLGMTGTVTGMITSFGAMSGIGGLDGGAVAAGISEALITTAAGLLIAIPCVAAYNVYCKKVDALTLKLEEKSSDMVEFIHLYLDRDAARG